MQTVIEDLGDVQKITVLNEGEFIASMTVKKGRDEVGDLFTASIDFAEYVYVNGHHWLDAEIKERYL